MHIYVTIAIGTSVTQTVNETIYTYRPENYAELGKVISRLEAGLDAEFAVINQERADRDADAHRG